MARKSLAESTLQDFAKLNSEKIPPPTQHGSREFTESNSNPPGFSEALRLQKRTEVSEISHTFLDPS